MGASTVDREPAVAEAVEHSLEQNEEIVRREAEVEFGSFLKAGRALADILDRKLYKKAKAKWSFEAYCDERLEHTKAYAYMKIGAFRVSTIVDAEPKPKNIAQTRPLARLLNEEGEDAVREVWASIVESRAKITAKVVQEAVRRRLADSETPPAPQNDPVSKKLLDARSTIETSVEAGIKAIKEAIDANAGEEVSDGMRDQYSKLAEDLRDLLKEVEKVARGAVAENTDDKKEED